MFDFSGSPHYVNQNIQSVKPNQGVASAATSSVKTSIVEKTGKPITSSCLTQSSDSFLHEGIEIGLKGGKMMCSKLYFNKTAIGWNG